MNIKEHLVDYNQYVDTLFEQFVDGDWSAEDFAEPSTASEVRQAIREDWERGEIKIIEDKDFTALYLVDLLAGEMYKDIKAKYESGFVTYEEVKANVVQSIADAIKAEDGALGLIRYHIGQADKHRCPIADEAMQFVESVLEDMAFGLETDENGTEEHKRKILDSLEEQKEDLLYNALELMEE